jgi:hypothetical protein
MGNKEELQKWGKMMNIYLKESPYLHRAIVLIDSEHLVSFKIFKIIFLKESTL